MSTYPEAPKSPCAQYTAALPALRAGALSVSERAALRTHLQQCDCCREQAESISWQVVEEAVHRHLDVPTEAMPFLSLADIRARTASSTMPSPEWTVLTEINANDPVVRLIDTGAVMRTQQERRISADEEHQTRRAPGRWRTSAAVMAVVALVAIFALVVHSFTATDHHPPTPATHQGTWAKQYTLQSPNDLPVVAPGDPSVVYRLSGSLRFQRSDDGGKTWRSYTSPNQKVIGDPEASLTLQVSPLHAMLVFATISSRPSNPNCPQVGYTAKITGSSSNELADILSLAGGYSCTFQYVSTDGGSSWSTPVVPIKGDLGQFFFTGGSQLNPPFVAQGDRLYSALSPDINGPQPQGFRLVSSTDGIHWSAADASLAAQNLSVYEYAATPAGSTLFVTTLPNSSAGGFNRELWRSDDAGVHWTDLGAFPEAQNPEDTTYLVGAGNVGSQAAVYYGTVSHLNSPPATPSVGSPLYPAMGGITANNVYASLNNGRTWRYAPVSGIPGGQRAAPAALGTLSDGSVVMAFDTRLSRAGNDASAGSLTFYSWRPGDPAWKQLSPSLELPSNLADLWTKSLWLITGQGNSPITILALVPQDKSFTLWSCALG
jgi:hypothetical protein